VLNNVVASLHTGASVSNILLAA